MTRFLLSIFVALLVGCAGAPERVVLGPYENISVEDLRAAVETVNREQRITPPIVVRDVEPSIDVGIGEQVEYDSLRFFLPPKTGPPFAQADVDFYNTWVGCSPFSGWSGSGWYLAPQCTPRPSFDLGLQTTLVPTTAFGSSTPTFGRNLASYLRDFEDRHVLVPANAARMQGARVVQNILTAGNYSSNDLTAWPVSGTFTATANATTDPWGGNNASSIVWTGANTGGPYTNNDPGTPSVSVRISLWLRADASGAINLESSNGTSATTLTIGTTWARYASPVFTKNSDGVFVRRLNAGQLSTIYVAGVLYEVVQGQTNQNPSETVLALTDYGANKTGLRYFDTLNGNTVASNVVTEATGALIRSGVVGVAATAPVDSGGPFGYLAESAATKYILQSNAFTTTWAGAGLTINQDAVAPDGTTTAWTIDDADAGNFRNISQVVTVANDNSPHTLSFYAKAGTSTDFRVDLYLTGGTAPNVFVRWNPATGVSTAQSAGADAPTAYTSTALANGWYLYTVTTTNNTSGATTLIARVYPAGASAAATGTLLLAWVGGEASAIATSYTPTTTAAVTRPADVLTYPSAQNISGTQGSYTAEVRHLAVAGIAETYVGDGASTRTLLYASSSRFFHFDGTNNTQFTTGDTVTSNTMMKVAQSWGGSTATGVVNGAILPIAGVFDGDYGFSSIGVGHSNSAQNLNGTIRFLRIYPRALRADQLQAKTAMIDLRNSRYMYAANDERWLRQANGR